MKAYRSIAVLLVVLVSHVPADVIRARNGRRQWLTPDAWTTGSTPRIVDLARISSTSQSQTVAVIKPGQDAVAATVRIGDRVGYTGTLEIQNGSLELERRQASGQEVGYLIVGTGGGSGVVRQDAGRVVVSRSVLIGSSRDSSGEYQIKDGKLIAESIETGSHTSAVSRMTVIGSSTLVRTEKLVLGPGACTLKLKADAFGPPAFEVEGGVSLSGSLEVDLSRFQNRSDEIMLIKNRGTNKVSGGFHQIALIGAKQYEIAYDGGTGNDVVLRRVRGVGFDRWADDRLADVPTGRPGWRRDSDKDGMDDLTEYKLGSQPKYDERWQTPAFDGSRSRIVYTERISRDDASVVLQVKANGQWRSDRVRFKVLSEEGDTRTIEASYTGRLAHRFYSELLPDPDRKMNVMLFVVDDLNDWVGCLAGHPQARTPAIDDLAARGCLFTGAHANGVNCNASRSSFLTGIHPATSGVYEHRNAFDENPAMKEAVTLPEHFTANNYRCLGAGKIFHAGGPDVWHDYGPTLSETGDIRTGGDFDTTQPHLAGGPSEQPARNFFDYKTATWMADRVAKMRASRPHFLAAGFYRPHLPWFAPEKFFNDFPLEKVLTPPRSSTDLNDLPSLVFDKGIIKTLDDAAIMTADLWPKATRAYLASTAFSDAQIKRVLKQLDSSSTVNNTIIVLISDHGHHLGEKHTWRKDTLWQESTRIPMIIVAPGVTTAGSRFREPVSLIDVYPTLAELTDTEAPGNQLEGQSLVAAMLGEERDEPSFAVSTRRYRTHSVADNDWRYIRYPAGEEELYDLSADKNEWTNLALDPDYESTIKDLRKRLPKINTRP